MNAMPRLLTASATMLAAFILTMGDANGGYFQPADVRKDLDDLVALLRAARVDQKKVKAVVGAMEKKHSLDDLMAVYKPTKSKGVGYDPAKPGPGDGIEKRLVDLGTKKVVPAVQLQAEKALLLRAVYYNLAMYEIAKEFGPPKKNPKNIASWNKHNEELKGGTMEMKKAIEANDPKALKQAMIRLNSSCTECHSEFR